MYEQEQKWNGKERRSQDERLVRVETLVETVTTDVKDLSTLLHNHVEQDTTRFEGLHKELAEGRMESKRLIDYVGRIATEVKENSEALRKHSMYVAYVAGGGIAVSVLIGAAWAVIKLVAG